MVRISLVHYLNAAPLGWSFLHGPFQGRYDVVSASPARCAQQLALGEADLGTIPSIEYQRIPGLSIVPGIAIASVQRVRSVLMIRRRHTRGISSVAMDTSSRTSVALLTILLRYRMGLTPEFVHCPPIPSEMLRRCDAALIIGDPALQIAPEEYDVTDLAEAWVQWQGTPFVFALWACRANMPEDLVPVLQEAKNWGCAMRHEIAAEYAGRLNLPASFLEQYLMENVDYEMGESHLQGLKSFYALAHRAGLIDELKPLRFLNHASVRTDGSVLSV